ncbi:hypothetical protein D0Y53_08295 [Luteimonas weifangensis]|uniref:Uncharacterized protein n=1 Tax=Cognatiluteimonas weifangensis TaxID=2303539 RepID=A0A372DLA4_9GAMM|nr:hypothetical protein D0Y53_08295 [Luteimonas weifangensis]
MQDELHQYSCRELALCQQKAIKPRRPSTTDDAGMRKVLFPAGFKRSGKTRDLDERPVERPADKHCALHSVLQ